MLLDSVYTQTLLILHQLQEKKRLCMMIPSGTTHRVASSRESDSRIMNIIIIIQTNSHRRSLRGEIKWDGGGQGSFLEAGNRAPVDKATLPRMINAEATDVDGN